MKANGNTINNMDRDQRDFRMESFIREHSNLVRGMARDSLNFQMDPITEAISKMDNLVAKVYSNGMMVVHSLDCGNSINSLEAQ